MVAKVDFTIRDYSGETGRAGIFIDSLANAVAMQTDVDGVSIGIVAQRTEISNIVEISANSPTDPAAQRELGLRIHFSDNVNSDLSSVTIPCPDVDNLTLVGDEVTLADAGIMAALVTEMELHGLSRFGNAITIERAEIVGRAN